jgi:hypothetical protein
LHRPIHTHAATYGHEVAASAARYANGTTHANGVTHRFVRTDINGLANAHHVIAMLGGLEDRSSEEQPAKDSQYGNCLQGRLQAEGSQTFRHQAANIAGRFIPVNLPAPGTVLAPPGMPPVLAIMMV